VNACAADTSCLCWTNCVAQDGTPASCGASCGAMDQATQALFACSTAMCPGKCP
jgi:hypothetical protein